MQALVSGVPQGSLIMLDLYAEVFPLWKRTKAFYGAPFIYCMLHNFGGNLEMYGAFGAVSSGPAEAMAACGTGSRPGSSGIIGVGMCPEGIEQNPIAYDLMSEWAFRQACHARFILQDSLPEVGGSGLACEHPESSLVQQKGLRLCTLHKPFSRCMAFA
jgi:hypothetical protein